MVKTKHSARKGPRLGPLVHPIAVIPTIPKNRLVLGSVLLYLAALQAKTRRRTLPMKMSWLIWREESLFLLTPLLPSPGLGGPPSSLLLLQCNLTVMLVISLSNLLYPWPPS